MGKGLGRCLPSCGEGEERFFANLVVVVVGVVFGVVVGAFAWESVAGDLWNTVVVVVVVVAGFSAVVAFAAVAAGCVAAFAALVFRVAVAGPVPAGFLVAAVAVAEVKASVATFA